MKNIMPVLLAGLLSACNSATDPDVKRHFIDDGHPHPLVVLLGGSEGGNTLAKPHFQPLMDSFHKHGMSVASLAYFGTPGTPSRQISLSLDDIATRISKLADDPRINSNCIAVYGFSKGAELALLLAAHFEHINHAVAVMPSHVSWNAVKTFSSQPGWQLGQTPLSYVDAPLISWPMQKGVVTGTYTPAFESALDDAAASTLNAARIPVEKTNGPVLLVSARQDEIWPSHRMANNIIDSLQQADFAYLYDHIELPGGHYSFNRETQAQVNQFLANTLVKQCQ
ncbi:acyl-CoA thioester hydrolase/BAAT C-terminal domain-containing protein [Pseudoalteromonas rubra]|uniref:Acyl-CoA thioester hydrolase n=1 Tax=Pseudoalteromonas rubra TaxID=43658 RepID=A0A0F4QY49_9GAMM|nr:acyl-CoA thioester hydrolase/BAAT C-terminal domain-containing protein [Pseudoalteromonas rubra]KJZ12628.1 acyl-CoA thioester hydrolase [Pseudoalteromonas rubra]